MGSPIDESGRYNDEHKHRVEITPPFYMGIHELTIGQFRQFVNATQYRTAAESDRKGGFGVRLDARPITTGYDRAFNWKTTGFAQSEDHPAANLTWNDANAFVDWLSREEAIQYRLPTEAEWEYACRAGSETAFQEAHNSNEVTKIGNVADQSFKAAGIVVTRGQEFVNTDDGYVFTAPVGSFQPNAFGLYDMTGNVCEWCHDWFNENYYLNSPLADPMGPEDGKLRVFRGGDWQSWPRHTRCASRARFEPEFRGTIGVRIVREEVTAIAESSNSEPIPSVPPANAQNYTNSVGMQFTRISSGEFVMGTSVPGNPQRPNDDNIQHSVKLTRPFYLGTHEVTVGQFRKFVTETGYQTTAETDQQGGNGYDSERMSLYDKKFNWMNTGYRQTDQHPATNLTRLDIDEFLRWLADKESQPFRLPTEAEWEFACRANGPLEAPKKGEANVADLAFFEGRVQLHTTDGNMASFKDGYVFTAPVGSLKPNALGLFDMTGNVSEWCADWFTGNYHLPSSQVDPSGPATGTERVVRGCSWRSALSLVQSMQRSHQEPMFRSSALGFRVALTAPGELQHTDGGHGADSDPKVAMDSDLIKKPQSDGTTTVPDHGEIQEKPEGSLAEPVIVQLDEPYSRFVVGGDGRFFIFHQPDADKLVVVDIASGSVVHELKPVLDDILFTAGADAFFLARPNQSTIERFSFETFRRERFTSMAGTSPAYALKMGPNAISPLFLSCKSDGYILDSKTLEPIAAATIARGDYGFEFQLAADGQTAVGIVMGLHPMRWQRIVVDGPESQPFSSDAEGAKHWSGPTADGSLILLPHRAFDRNLQEVPMGTFAKDRLVPTVDPRFFLAVRFGIGHVECQICNVADRRSIYTIRDFEDMMPIGDTKQHNAISKRLTTDPDASFHYFPKLNSFVTLGWDKQTVSIYPVDLEKALERKGAPYLYVTFIPPQTAVRGSELSHQFKVFSNDDNIAWELDSPVEGLSLSPQGELHWNVPIEFSEKTIPFLVRASSKDNEVFVQFDVNIEDPPEPPPVPSKEIVHMDEAPKNQRDKRPVIAKGQKSDVVVILAENLHWPLSAENAKNVDLPGLEFLTREGVTFSNAFVASTVPTAAQATVLTGRWPWRLESAANYMGTLPQSAPTFIEALRDAGYYTSFKGIRWAPGRVDPPSRKPVGNKDITHNGLSPHRQQAHCFWLPEFIPDRLRANASGSLSGENMDVPKHLPNVKIVRGDLEAYLQEIALFDRAVSTTLSALRKAETLDNTIIIVTSLYGAPLPRGRGNHYDFGTKVPLILYWQDVAEPGKVVDEFVSLVDIAPTLYEIAGLEVPLEMDGNSLLPLLGGSDKTDRSFVIHGRERYICRDRKDLTWEGILLEPFGRRTSSIFTILSPRVFQLERGMNRKPRFRDHGSSTASTQPQKRI